MRAVLALAAVAVLAGWGVVRHLPEREAAADALPAPRVQQIGGVAIEGHNLPLATLRSVLTTHAGDQLDSDHLRRDRDAMEHALAARGYLAARVAPAQLTFGSDGVAYVSFAVTLGPEYHLGAVTVTGASALDAGVVTLGAGELVVQDRLAHARDALADRLASRGKPHAVAVELARDDATATIAVTLAVR